MHDKNYGYQHKNHQEETYRLYHKFQELFFDRFLVGWTASSSGGGNLTPPIYKFLIYAIEQFSLQAKF